MQKTKLIGFVLAASGLLDIALGGLLLEGVARLALTGTGAVSILAGLFFLLRGWNEGSR